MIIIAGNSESDFDYKTKMLAKIVAETGGQAIPKLLDDPKVAGGCLWRWLRSTGSIREVFRVSGCFGGEVGGTDVFRLMSDYIYNTGKMKGDLIKQGLVYDDGTSPFTQSFEHGHFGHGELLIRYMANPTTFKVLTTQFLPQANETAIRDHYGVPGHVFGDMSHDMYGPHCLNYHLWLRKIKKAVDPNGTSEASHYISNSD